MKGVTPRPLRRRGFIQIQLCLDLWWLVLGEEKAGTWVNRPQPLSERRLPRLATVGRGKNHWLCGQPHIHRSVGKARPGLLSGSISHMIVYNVSFGEGLTEAVLHKVTHRKDRSYFCSPSLSAPVTSMSTWGPRSAFEPILAPPEVPSVSKSHAPDA